MEDKLVEKLKEILVETLRLEDIKPADIGDDDALMGSGLALDSIDALELVVRLEKEFGIKIKSSEESKEALGSVAKLAAYLRRNADQQKLAAFCGGV